MQDIMSDTDAHGIPEHTLECWIVENSDMHPGGILPLQQTIMMKMVVQHIIFRFGNRPAVSTADVNSPAANVMNIATLHARLGPVQDHSPPTEVLHDATRHPCSCNTLEHECVAQTMLES